MNPETKLAGIRGWIHSWKARSLLALVGLALIFWAFWWDSPPRYNDPVSTGTTPVPAKMDFSSRGMWPALTNQDDNTLMMVAFSGGGSRAAAVAWQTLATLQQMPCLFQNARGDWVESNLAREIDLTAGISGGSFAAAAWCLSHEDLSSFRKSFVERDIQGALARHLVSMDGLKTIFSRRFSRIDVASELYDREVFDGATFSQLPSRPILLIHATDLALGQRFTFSADTFGLIGSSLSSYPVGYACAASSAFPILLDPLTLKNYGPTEAAWKALAARYNFAQANQRNDVEQYFRKLQWDNYRNFATNQYIHLADGGLADNQGLQSLLDQFTDGIVAKRLNQTPALQRLILVNVNAGVASDSGMDHSPSPPGIGAVVEGAMVTSMDLLSAKRWEEVKSRSAEIYRNLRDLAAANSSASTETLQSLEEPYLIEVNFRNLRDPILRQQALSLPTSFKLSSTQLDLIAQVVPQLLYEDPALQRLLTVQLAKVVLLAQSPQRQAVLQNSVMNGKLNFNLVTPADVTAVRVSRQPNLLRIASTLVQALQKGSATLDPQVVDPQVLQQIAGEIKPSP